jgi:hypothetical protein
MGIVDDLRNERKIDETNTNNLVKAMYESCLKIIKLKNKMGGTDMIYEIPYIFVGFPVYERESISLKLNKYLKKQGFKTTYYPPCKIYINW